MAVVRPFKAVRPKKSHAFDVAAPPYDVMNSEEAREMAEGNPNSFLRIDRAEINFSPGTDMYSDKVYEMAREKLENLCYQGVCFQDEEPMLYIYRQEMGTRSQTGIVACVSVDDYLNNVIKKHELTRADKELDRIRHVDACDANTGPIFLTYRTENTICSIIEKYTAKEAEYDFCREDGVRHTVWLIDNKQDIEKISESFAKVESLYIADGHHRAMSAVRVGQKRREQYPKYTGEEEFNFFLAILYNSNELEIMDYNRVLKDFNGYTKEELLERLRENFNVEKHEGKDCYRPTQRHEFGFYLENEWYKLNARPEIIDENDPIARLDVSILQRYVITPIFGIDDPRTDDRIDFVGGIRGLKELERRVEKDMAAAFSMFPTTIDDLMCVSDNDQIMPPKSTWFEPKPLSGLFIHKLSD